MQLDDPAGQDVVLPDVVAHQRVLVGAVELDGVATEEAPEARKDMRAEEEGD